MSRLHLPCDCIASGNTNKPKQHGADPHAKTCESYIKLNPQKVGVSVTCRICEHRKAPIGRSVPFGMEMCHMECRGYRAYPYPGSLWPGESEAEFGYPVSNDGTEIANG
jgi:hypothetical protein